MDAGELEAELHAMLVPYEDVLVAAELYGIILGSKQDLCATSNAAGPHLILRRVRWAEIFFSLNCRE